VVGERRGGMILSGVREVRVEDEESLVGGGARHHGEEAKRLVV
jgi:hypothetical protein